MFTGETSSRSVLCLECMHENSPGAGICEKCGARLVPEYPPPKLQDILVDIKEAVDAYEKGDIRKKEFESFLVATKNNFEKKLAEVQKIEIPADFKVEMKEEMNYGISGVKAIIQACDLLERYLASGNFKFREEGLSLAEVGTDQLNRAIQLNWEKFQALREMVEEFIKKDIKK
ncbi:MAG: zinc ribbon domain-containing protein [Candidatus Eremiobacteraeota bacterium]|nr:zinc ribbon domain-containing protein [Candidatus Eremiobacteraeota bacterium]